MIPYFRRAFQPELPRLRLLGAFRFSYRVAPLGGDLECADRAAAFERVGRFIAEKPAQAMLAPFPIRPLLA
jgi:hypothetical protein